MCPNVHSEQILVVLAWQPASQCPIVPQITFSVPVLANLCYFGACSVRSPDTPSSSTWLRPCMRVRGTGPTSWKALGGAGAAYGGGPRPTSRFFQDFTTPSDSFFGFCHFSLLATHERPSCRWHETHSTHSLAWCTETLRQVARSKFRVWVKVILYKNGSV